MFKSKELREKIDEVIKEQRELLDTAKKEERDFTPDEQSKFDGLNHNFNSLNHEYNVTLLEEAREAIEITEKSDTGIQAINWENGNIKVSVHSNKAAKRSNEEHVGHAINAYLSDKEGLNETEKRALASTAVSSGGATITGKLASQFIQNMTDEMVLTQAGMSTMTFDGTNSYKLAKVLTPNTVTFKAENAEGAASDPTFGNVEFTPYTAFSLVKMSNEVRDDSVNLVEAVRDTISREFAVFVQNKILFGSGNAEPLGIDGLSNAVSISMGTNGATFSNYDNLVNLIRDVKNNNFNPTALVGAPRSMASLAVLKDSQNQYLIPPKYLENYPMLETTAIPIDQTQGTNNASSTIFTGDFTKLYLGIRAQLQITPLNERYAEFNQTAFLATMRFDSQPFYEEAFGKLIGIR